MLNKLWNWMRRANRQANFKLDAAHSSESWIEERTFWFERSNRAFIRFMDAIEREDQEAAKIASQQHSLYKRRFDAVPVPPGWREEQARKLAAERRAALDEE